MNIRVHEQYAVTINKAAANCIGQLLIEATPTLPCIGLVCLHS